MPKKPFSAKQKKFQLQEKRRRKNRLRTDSEESRRHIPKAKEKGGHQRCSKYTLMRRREENVEASKEAAREELSAPNEKLLEVGEPKEFYPATLHFPKRPPWNYSMSPEELNANEAAHFNNYLKNIEENFGKDELNFFELNLELWRQLWRVLEMADIVLLIADVRFAPLMFPPSLYEYVTSVSKKMILILNKIDLIPSSLTIAWENYFKNAFPFLQIISFTSFPKDKVGRGKDGRSQLLEACRQVTKEVVDLSDWAEKIKEDILVGNEDEDVKIEEKIAATVDSSYYEHESYKNGILTMGCVGFPNAGKSSVINALMGKKVVSVSKTPGHTKHFQTIFLTKTVKLCDCPGLVFPSKAPKPLQVLMGSFPIAQVRDPFSTVKFVAERIDLISFLRIKHPENDDRWSAMDICEGWAQLRGFVTARTARLDAYRGANHLLRLISCGKVPFFLRPKGFGVEESGKNLVEGEIMVPTPQSHEERSTDEDPESNNESNSEGMESGSGDEEEDSAE